MRKETQSGRAEGCHAISALIAVLMLLFAATVHAQKHPPAHPVNLNTATLEQLEELPGIGPVAAQKILEMRQKSGPFRRIDDLLAVRGISPKRLDKLRPYLTISSPSPAKK